MDFHKVNVGGRWLLAPPPLHGIPREIVDCVIADPTFTRRGRLLRLRSAPKGYRLSERLVSVRDAGFYQTERTDEPDQFQLKFEFSHVRSTIFSSILKCWMNRTNFFFFIDFYRERKIDARSVGLFE